MLKGNFWYSIHCSLAELRYTKQIQGVKREPNPTASGLVRNNVMDIAVVHRKTYNQLIQPPIISIPPSTIHNIWGIFIRTTFSVSRQCSGVRTCHAGRAGGSILSFAVCKFESSCWKALRGLNKMESLHPPTKVSYHCCPFTRPYKALVSGRVFWFANRFSISWNRDSQTRKIRFISWKAQRVVCQGSLLSSPSPGICMEMHSSLTCLTYILHCLHFMHFSCVSMTPPSLSPASDLKDRQVVSWSYADAR